MTTAPRHDLAGLAARIRALNAEIIALDERRASKDAERGRLINQLARLPGDEVEPASARQARPIPLKTARNLSGLSEDTILRHGVPGRWAWKRGGRWVVDPEGLDRFTGRPAPPL